MERGLPSPTGESDLVSHRAGPADPRTAAPGELAQTLGVEQPAEAVRPAEDAAQIDTTDLEVGDVVSRIEELVQQRLAASRS